MIKEEGWKSPSGKGQRIMCVVMRLHNGQVGSLPSSGRPPTRQVSPAGYMFLCSPHGDQ